MKYGEYIEAKKRPEWHVRNNQLMTSIMNICSSDLYHHLVHHSFRSNTLITRVSRTSSLQSQQRRAILSSPQGPHPWRLNALEPRRTLLLRDSSGSWIKRQAHFHWYLMPMIMAHGVSLMELFPGGKGEQVHWSAGWETAHRPDKAAEQDTQCGQGCKQRFPQRCECSPYCLWSHTSSWMCS